MYSNDEMILWSLISSLVVKIKNMEILALDCKLLFLIFKKSLAKDINLFTCDYNVKLELLNSFENGKKLEKIKELFSDLKYLENLTKQVKVEKNKIIEKNIKYITYLCEKYPEQLRKGEVPPYVIYYKGYFPNTDDLKNSFGIIGSRNIKNLEIDNFIWEIGKLLKEKKCYNISGLALGCDTKGHEITLSLGIKNIAILGYGLSQEIYPKENKELSKKIQLNGAIISELPPTVSIKKIYLIQRNRLQVYLSKNICLLESGEKGGSMITVKIGLKEKKKIFVYNSESNYKIFNKKQLNKIRFINSKKDLEKELLESNSYKLF